uniref:F-box domain-containing protein n=1 Tax=Arundo donax TaxID=35708 RepID=A0A0A9BXV8_ARUDO
MASSSRQDSVEEAAEIEPVAAVEQTPEIEVAKAEDQVTQEHEEEDRLSKLPDDILMHILDRLKLLREAVRTSILSKRWRHLTGLHSEIVLDVKHYQPKVISSNYTLDELVQANMSVVKASKSILAHKSNRVISYLSITFYLRDESIDIVRSVENAMSNREVVRAEFKILPEMLEKYCTHDDKITYGRRFMAFMNACPRAFCGLTELRLYSLRLGKTDIPNVLETCEKLEYLCLQNCDAGIRSVLQIKHPQLLELTVIACAFETIELNWLPRLTHFTCQTWMPSSDTYPLSFGYVPQLLALILSNMASTLHQNLKLSEILRNAVIAELDLNFQCQRIWIQPEDPKILAPLLQNLQKVRLRFVHEECDLTWTVFFLEAAPLLKEINIQVWDHKCYSNEGDMYKQYREIFQKTSDHLNCKAHGDFKHYNLSRLTIEGLEVEDKFTRYIRQVMKAAVNLELVSLIESRTCGRCRFRPSRSYPRTDEERDKIRKQILDWRSSPVEIKFGI